MILTAHQPTYLPWLGLFHKIAIADLFISYDTVQYQTDNWNHRNKIKTSAGAQWLTLSVSRRSHMNSTLSEMALLHEKPWAKKHWRSILQNYRKAPYFSLYADFFEDLYQKEWHSLVELNGYMLRWFLQALGINTTMQSATELQIEGRKNDLALEMCRKTGAKVLIFGALGKQYADVGAFNAVGCTPYFQDYNHPIYPQLYGDFVSHLSIIDLLFNCGDNSLEILMSNNVNKQNMQDLIE